MAAKIKKGDRVVMMTGKDKGKSGDVLRVMPDKARALVQGVNVAKRHQRQ
ncbi:MAG: 50S ribosomal protein L24, partial [Hyphomicrobiales bacterium]